MHVWRGGRGLGCVALYEFKHPELNEEKCHYSVFIYLCVKQVLFSITRVYIGSIVTPFENTFKHQNGFFQIKNPMI